MSLKDLARQALDLIEAGRYTAPSGALVDFGDWQREALAGSRLWTPDALQALFDRPGAGGATAAVEVIDATTQEAAQALAAEGPVTLLNFASARNPGGGFLNGAKAQEEDLCRCSGLYPTLTAHMAYYEANRAQSSLIYTDHMIHSPGVPFFKVRGGGELLERPFRASVITAPAPNRANPRVSDAALEAGFERRWGLVLALAQAMGADRLVLGAWGCGAFHNDPAMVADAVAEHLRSDRFRGAFQRVVFAIPDRGRQGAENFAAFRRRLT